MNSETSKYVGGLVEKMSERMFWSSDILGKQTNMAARFELINREKANAMLKKPLGTQRPLNRAFVKNLSDAMYNGEYIDDLINPIFISDTGKLMEGQHRLHAVANTGKEYKFLVVTGLPENTFVYIDQCRARAAKDVIRTSGVKNPQGVSGTTKLLYHMIEGTRANPRHEVLLRMVEDYPDLEKCVRKGNSLTHSTHIQPNVAAVMYFLYSKKYPEIYENFFDMLEHGSVEFSANKEHPVARLRGKLTREWKKDGSNRGRVAYIKRKSNDTGELLHENHVVMCYIHSAFMAFVKGNRTVKWELDLRIIDQLCGFAREVITLRHGYRSTEDWAF